MLHSFLNPRRRRAEQCYSPFSWRAGGDAQSSVILLSLEEREETRRAVLFLFLEEREETRRAVLFPLLRRSGRRRAEQCTLPPCMPVVYTLCMLPYRVHPVVYPSVHPALLCASPP